MTQLALQSSSRPSSFPTSIPTAIPTSHPSQALPRVVRVTLSTVTKTSIQLSVSLAAESGIVYGGIFTTPQTSSKVVAVVIRQSRSNILRGVNHTSLLFSSLTPATSYYVYLVTVAGDGSRVSTPDEVMSSAVVVTTACCRVIEVAAVSGVVAGSGEVVVSAAQTVTHFLSIRVRDKAVTSPSLFLRLYAVQGSNNESLSEVIRPSVIDLSSSASSDLSASLSALSAGTYYIRANLTGSDAGRYEVQYIANTTSSSSWTGLEFRVVGSQLPAPSLVSAIFSNDGTALTVSFSSDTNQPSPVVSSTSTTSFSCDNVLDFPCATSSTCRWTDRRSLVATVKSADYCASPGDVLRLSETVTLKAACDDSCGDYSSWPSTNTSTSAVVISSGSGGSGPQVILSLPSQLGQCSALALDVTASTGSAGRSWKKSSVNVTATNTATSNTTSTDSLEALQSYVSSTSFDITRSPPPSIPSHLLSPDVIYSFNVTLCNFLQRCGQTVRSVAVVGREVPVVKILGASELSMTRSQSLSLTSSVSLASCSSSSTSLTLPKRVSYVWTVQKMTSSSLQVVTVMSVSRDPSRFVLPSFSFQGTSLYRILLNATTSTSTASAAVTVSVGEGKVVAVVQGGVVGGVKGVRVGGVVTLDASKSYDEDQQGALMWQWGCVQLSPSVNGSCDVIFSPLTSSQWSSSVLSVRVSEVADGYLARLSVDVSVVSDSGKKRQGSASVRVMTLPAMSPTITLTSNAAFQGVQGGAIMNAGQSLLVTAAVSLPASSSSSSSTTSFNATWSLQTSDSSSTASDVNLNAVSLTPVTQILSTTSSTVKVYLSLPGNVLASGLSYSFSLTLTPSASSSSSDVVLGGASSVVIAVNAPPQPGVFEVSPGWGREVLDAFTFACSVWTDVDLPLSYQFGYWSLSGSKMVARSMSVLSYASSILLPGGARERNYSIIVFADVFDSLSADTTVTHSLAVLPSTVSNTSSSSSVATSFVSKYLNFSSGDQGSVDSLLQVTSLGSYLLHRANCSLTPNCTSLHRLPCYATPHTCGPCMTSSMIGTSGDANDRCYNPGDLSVSPNDVIGSSLKQCVGGCSGHGQCVFLSTLTYEEVSGECYEGDVACTASCVCDVGYRSSASGKCAEEVQGGADDLLARQTALKQVSEGVVAYVSMQEMTEQTVTSWLGSVSEVVGGGSSSDAVSSDTLTTLLDVVSYAMTSASSLSDVTESLSGLPDTLDKIASASLTSSLLSSSTGRRRLGGESNSSDIMLGQVIGETLRNYTVLVGEGMAPGQAATTVVQRNFRLHVENIDLTSPPTTSPTNCTSSSSKNLSVSLPSSALEALYHSLPTSSLTLPLPPPPCNTSSTSTTTSLVMSVTSVSRDLYSNSSFLSDVTSLHLSQHPCSSEREECEVVVVLQTTNTTSHTITPTSHSNNVTVTCVAGDHSLKEVFCAEVDKSFSVQCSGKEEKVVAHCPSIKVVPTCADVRGSACRLIQYTESNVTCGCSLPLPSTPSNTLSRGLLEAADNTTSSSGVGSAVVDVQYVAMLKSIEESFVTTVVSASLLDASTVEDSWQVLVTLGSLVAVVIAALLFSHYADKEVCKKIDAEEKMIQHAKNTHYLSRYLQRPSNTPSYHKRGSGRHSQSMNRQRTHNADSITTLAEEALPSILSSQSVGSRVKTELRRHHRWIGVIYYFSSKFPRVYRVMSLASNIIIMLFIQSLTYAFTKQDPSTCTQYVTEESCLEPSSVFRTGEHQCLWQGQGTGQGQQGGDCVYVTPDNSIEVVVFVAIFSALATTPIALLVDWIINVILIAPTTSDSDEVSSEMKERKYALSSFRSSFSTSFSLPRLVPVVPASGEEHKDDDVNRTSMSRKATHDEDKIRISLKAREEFEEMRSALLRYRERALHTTDLEEFNRLWGLTEDGQFRVIHLDDGLGVGVGKTHSIERIIEREIVELHYSLEKELLRFQEGGVGGGGGSSSSTTSVVLRSERARTKRLLYLFQRDLIPGISGEILDNKEQRDNVTLTPVSRNKKMLAWLVLTLLDAGMLFYVFLFAVSQDSHSQSAWGQSLAVWLLLEVVVVSTSICVVMHVLLPSLVMKDVTQIKKKLQDSLRKYYDKVETQRKAGQVFLTQSDLVNSFNAAHYLFLSYRLAETFPELKASQVILQYTTPWPRQSYHHMFDVAKNYDGKWAALTRAASTIIVFFLTSLISLPAVVQDIIVQCTVVSAFGYTLLLHIRLYSIFPVLVIVPALVLLALAHFLYTSFKKQQEVEKAKMTHFLTDTTTTGKEVEDGVVEGGQVGKKEGVLKQLSSRLKPRHQINVINTAPRQQRGGNTLPPKSSKYEGMHEEVPVVKDGDVAQALTITEHVMHKTRRQSVQQGIHVMRRLQDISQGERQRLAPLHEREKGSDNNHNNNDNYYDEGDYHFTESEIDSEELQQLRQQTQPNEEDEDNSNISPDLYTHNITYNKVVMAEESEGYEGCEGYDVVKNEREELKDDDVDSIDFLFNDNNEDDDEDDEALHLPPHSDRE